MTFLNICNNMTYGVPYSLWSITKVHLRIDNSWYGVICVVVIFSEPLYSHTIHQMKGNTFL